ncbi:MAG: PilN domain-containing protein [Planctomycetota bacterium JB042]
MIRIDLLPPEYRRAERTAPAQFMATIGLVALFSSAAAGCAYAWFGVVGGARADVENAKEVLESKKPQAVYSDSLEKEKKEYTARMDHIKTFSQSRILWTKKLDQLASLVDSPPEQDRHMVWLEELRVNMNDARSPGLRMKGHSATSHLKKLSDFNSDLKTPPFFSEFVGISVPEGKVVTDEEFDPSSAWEFEASLTLTDPNPTKKTASRTLAPVQAPKK